MIVYYTHKGIAKQDGSSYCLNIRLLTYKINRYPIALTIFLYTYRITIMRYKALECITYGEEIVAGSEVKNVCGNNFPRFHDVRVKFRFEHCVICLLPVQHILLR